MAFVLRAIHDIFLATRVKGVKKDGYGRVTEFEATT